MDQNFHATPDGVLAKGESPPTSPPQKDTSCCHILLTELSFSQEKLQKRDVTTDWFFFFLYHFSAETEEWAFYVSVCFIAVVWREIWIASTSRLMRNV